MGKNLIPIHYIYVRHSKTKKQNRTKDTNRRTTNTLKCHNEIFFLSHRRIRNQF